MSANLDMLIGDFSQNDTILRKKCASCESESYIVQDEPGRVEKTEMNR